MRDEQSGRSVSAASLRTDLELARDQIRALRAERDKLREKTRLQLGQQLDQLSAKDLTARIDELTQDNSRLAAQLGQATGENTQQRQRVTELEDDLAAARTSLRRMIRSNNQPPSP